MLRPLPASVKLCSLPPPPKSALQCSRGCRKESGRITGFRLPTATHTLLSLEIHPATSTASLGSVLPCDGQEACCQQWAQRLTAKRYHARHLYQDVDTQKPNQCSYLGTGIWDTCLPGLSPKATWTWGLCSPLQEHPCCGWSIFLYCQVWGERGIFVLGL